MGDGCRGIAPWDRNEKDELILERPPEPKLPFGSMSIRDSERSQSLLRDGSGFRVSMHGLYLGADVGGGGTHGGWPVASEKVGSGNG
jgi:hypothetical protein